MFTMTLIFIQMTMLLILTTLHTTAVFKNCLHSTTIIVA